MKIHKVVSEKPMKSVTCLNDSISSFVKEALGRGRGQACVATHGGGCRHCSLVDLKSLERQNFLYYSKSGGWLDGKSCFHCKLVPKDMIYDKVSKAYMRYCEMGLKSLKYVSKRTESDLEM